MNGIVIITMVVVVIVVSLFVVEDFFSVIEQYNKNYNDFGMDGKDPTS